MSIKFECPNCERRLSVKDELAGKRGKCPQCKKPITIPMSSEEGVPATSAPAAKRKSQAAPKPAPAIENDEAGGPPPNEEELESVAADLFSDEPGEEDHAEEIEFECPECIEEIKMPREMAGQRAPCPECSRIIRVPEPKSDKPKTWRDATRGPAGARRIEFEEKPEGAWTPEKTVASREALEEAEALPAQNEPRTLAEKIRLGAYAACGVAVLGLLVVWLMSWWGARKERLAVEEALAFADKTKGTVGGALHTLGIAYYHTQAEDGSATLANDHFKKALGALRSPRKDVDQEIALMDLAVTYLDLSGSPEDVESEKALPWKNVYGGLLPTIQAMTSFPAKRETLRLVARKMIEKGEAKRAVSLANQTATLSEEKIEAIAVVGIELYRAGHKKEALAIADQVADHFAKNKKAPPTQAAVALALIAGKPAPKLPEASPDLRYLRAGEAEALVRRGDSGGVDRAKSVAGTASNPADAFLQWLPLAMIQAEGKSQIDSAIERTLTEASRLPAGANVDPWDVVRFCGAAGRSGVSKEKIEPVFAKIPDAKLKARAQLEYLRGSLASSESEVPSTVLDEFDSKTLSHKLAAAAIARHNAKLDSGWLSTASDWSEPMRAFGQLGAAQGLREAE